MILEFTFYIIATLVILTGLKILIDYVSFIHVFISLEIMYLGIFLFAYTTDSLGLLALIVLILSILDFIIIIVLLLTVLKFKLI